MNLNFILADDDFAIRSMISEIIEDNDLGKVVGEAQNGYELTNMNYLLSSTDIVITDFLMPEIDGMDAVKYLKDEAGYKGKFIMLSQVEDKELISEAYRLGVEYFIMKPINKLEVISIIKKVEEYINLEKTIKEIQNSLKTLGMKIHTNSAEQWKNKMTPTMACEYILTELGIISESGSRDLVDIINLLFEAEEPSNMIAFPSLKDLFIKVSKKRLGSNAKETQLNKEVKATEQRVRRAVAEGLTHMASIGLTDYASPKFEEYSSKFFNFTEIRKRMLELEENIPSTLTQAHINTKKFVKVLYLEVKKEKTINKM